MQHEQACRIILVRHGETEANVRGHFAESDDIPLTEAGRAQARDLAVRLARDFNPIALISSTFLRARETSDIIASALGLKPEVIEGIHERDFGSLRGHPYSRVAEFIQDAELADPEKIRTWRPEGGESLEDVWIIAACGARRPPRSLRGPSDPGGLPWRRYPFDLLAHHRRMGRELHNPQLLGTGRRSYRP